MGLSCLISTGKHEVLDRFSSEIARIWLLVLEEINKEVKEINREEKGINREEEEIEGEEGEINGEEGEIDEEENQREDRRCVLQTRNLSLFVGIDPTDPAYVAVVRVCSGTSRLSRTRSSMERRNMNAGER